MRVWTDLGRDAQIGPVMPQCLGRGWPTPARALYRKSENPGDGAPGFSPSETELGFGITPNEERKDERGEDEA